MQSAWLPSEVATADFAKSNGRSMQVLQFLKHAEANHTDAAVSRFFKLYCIRVHTAVGAALIAGLALPQVLASIL